MQFFDDYFAAYFFNRQSGWAYIVFQVLSCASLAFLFLRDFILEKPHSKKINRVCFSVLKGISSLVMIYALHLLLSIGVNFLIVSNRLSFYFQNYLVYPLLMIMMIPFGRKKWMERLSRCLVLYNAFCIIPTLSRFISMICSGEVYGLAFEFFDTFFSVFLLFAFVMVLYVLDSEKFVSNNILSILLVMAVESLVLIVSLLNDPSFSTTEQLKVKHVVIFSGLYCVSLFMYLFHYLKQNGQEEALEIQKNAFAKTNEKEMMELALENGNQIKKMEEDMNQQYQHMADLLKNEDYGKLKQYFADLSETSFVPLTFVDCGNNAISCIMNIEIAKANKCDIKIHYAIMVPKEGMGIDDYDLCSFFTNVIDNAIEGTCRNKINQSKDIYVNITYKKPYLISTVTNPVDLKQEDLAMATSHSSKDDEQIHGYGTKIINAIAKKYGDGIVDYSISNGVFKVSSILLSKEE